MNQKPGLIDSVSCPKMEIPGCKLIYELRSQIEIPIEPRRAKQQTKSSAPNQLKLNASSGGHHRAFL